MRLSPRVFIAGLAVLVGGLSAGCSASAGLAYQQGNTHQSAAKPVATRAAAPAAKTAKAAPVKAAPARKVPVLDVVGAPQGVKAKAGMLVDASTGQVLWDLQGSTVRPIASITKVMTALIVMQAGTPNKLVTFPLAAQQYALRYGANAAGLIPGQVFTTDQLLHALLIVSAGDAAYTLANAYGPGLPAFVAKMNAEAAKLGLKNTHFTSPDGLPYPTETATHSTAAELVKLGEVAMTYPEFRSIVGLKSFTLPTAAGHGSYQWNSSNELIGTYPGAVGIKTGYTRMAGHTLLFEAIRGGRTLIGVVLGSPPTGPGAGAQDATKVLNWGFALKKVG